MPAGPRAARPTAIASIAEKSCRPQFGVTFSTTHSRWTKTPCATRRRGSLACTTLPPLPLPRVPKTTIKNAPLSAKSTRLSWRALLTTKNWFLPFAAVRSCVTWCKMVGTLLDVGRGKLTAADIERLYELRDRSKSGPTVPPQGLVMVEVQHEEAWRVGRP